MPRQSRLMPCGRWQAVVAPGFMPGGRWRRRRPGCAGDKPNPGATAKPQQIVPSRPPCFRSRKHVLDGSRGGRVPGVRAGSGHSRPPSPPRPVNTHVRRGVPRPPRCHPERSRGVSPLLWRVARRPPLRRARATWHHGRRPARGVQARQSAPSAFSLARVRHGGPRRWVRLAVEPRQARPARVPWPAALRGRCCSPFISRRSTMCFPLTRMASRITVSSRWDSLPGRRLGRVKCLVPGTPEAALA